MRVRVRVRNRVRVRGEGYILFLRIAIGAEILCQAMAKECQNVDDVWVPSLLCRRSYGRCRCRVHGRLFIVVVHCPMVVVICHHQRM